MPVSAGMKDHLKSNLTFLCEVWKIVATDGTVAAYAAHTRDIAYNSVNYKSAPVEPSRPARKIGLEPDIAELTGALDDQITEADIVGGKWKRARITKEIICYLDTSLGHALKQVGFAGEFQIRNGLFTVEFQSISSLLQQQIGDLTSPIDRRRRLDELGIDITSFTHARTVASFVDRRTFTVGGTAQADGYFQYGLARFTSGANSGLEMEIKNNVGNVISLQLPMRSAIANGDAVTLYRGYDGTRETAKLLGAEVVDSFEGEPDLPGLRSVLTYPE